MEFLEASLIELITQTSTNLPPDVRQAMGVAIGAETPHTQSSQALSIIASNIDMAAEDGGAADFDGAQDAQLIARKRVRFLVSCPVLSKNAGQLESGPRHAISWTWPRSSRAAGRAGRAD